MKIVSHTLFVESVIQMESSKSHLLIIFFFVMIFPQMLVFEFAFADDKITSIHSLKDDDSKATLVSSGQTFELGFFSPGNSKNRYIGIWYKITPDVVVWVANRNNPLNDSFGELTISEKGDLVLLDREKSVVWYSNSSRAVKNPVAQLLDDGNFVLMERESTSSESYLWQSFDDPSDTLLAGMKLGWDLRTGLQRNLTSWKSFDDPSNGNATFWMDIKGLPQLISSMGSERKLRIGPWNGVLLSGVVIRSETLYKGIYVSDENESYCSYIPKANSVVTRLTLNYEGELQRLVLQNVSNKWAVMYSLPYDKCDSYNYCGANAVCSVNGDPMCQCLKGFTPSSREEWEVLNWDNGCVRMTPLECHRGDGFVKLGGLKLPDLLQFSVNKSMSLKECKDFCFKDCSCVAYVNSNVSGKGSGCLVWFGELIDIRELRVSGKGQDVYVRLSASEIKLIGVERKRRKLKIIIAASISSGICIFALLFGFITWKLRQRIKGKIEDEGIELPLFDLATVKSATKNFSPENMVGKGGFGPVYKGNLSTGQEVAVKRMSEESGQGPKEFKNEVDLIAKLQHKNLVALLGCCIQGDERILIYEYMINKSLDHFIFGLILYLLTVGICGVTNVTIIVENVIFNISQINVV